MGNFWVMPRSEVVGRFPETGRGRFYLWFC